MKSTTVLKEAKRLSGLGFALHWLQPLSKRPVGNKWSEKKSLSYEELKAQHTDGLNLGVRLGKPSEIDGKFLCAIDVDVKSEDPKHEKEALKVVKNLLGDAYATCPQVRSGRGNGSRHFYVLSEEALAGFTVAESEDEIEVLMPSVKSTRKQIEHFGEEKSNEGWRLRPAWTVDVMGHGRQTVLPPSLHPDTRKAYVWVEHASHISDFPVIAFNAEEQAMKKPERADTSNFEFEAVDVELGWLPISEKMLLAIQEGEGVDDRSAFLLSACRALISAGLNQNEILSVLTDRNTYLGDVGYDHAQTDNRKRAAKWVYKYSLAKIYDERSAEALFAEAATVEKPKLTKEDLEAQTEELKSQLQWADRLQKTKDGVVRNTFFNCRLILQNADEAKKPLIGRNLFAVDDYYLAQAPWGGRPGDPITDVDFVRIKNYCAQKYRAEFSINTIVDAVISVGDANHFHPVQDYLRSLTWDGVERMSTWLQKYCGSTGPKEYLEAVCTKFLVAMVQRVFNPGSAFHQVLILEGKQNAGKSSVARVLGAPWFTDSPIHIGDKDAVMTMQSKWVVELGELSSMSKADIEQLKAFITQSVDRIRPSYGRKVMDYPRQSVFIGTTNNEQYLKDLTGNRRYWPVKVADVINWKGLAQVRDQLFAEAFLAYQLGESVWLNPDLIIEAETEQALRVIGDEWAPIVLEVLESEGFPEEFYLRDLASRMDQVGAQRLDGTTVNRLIRCLKLLGYENFRTKDVSRSRKWRKKLE